MTDSDITFFSNDETNMHCFQATMAMILSKLVPEKKFTVEELVKLSGSVAGMSTWPSRMLIELQKMGLESVLIEGFDGKKFIEKGEDYLREAFSGDTAEWQIANGDIEKEQHDYREMYDKGVHIENRIPDISDIKTYLQNGYMIQCMLNANTLVGKQGYTGHSVLILSADDNHVIIHNPGLPPMPNQQVDTDTFVKAWSYPNEMAKTLIAVRRIL